MPSNLGCIALLAPDGVVLRRWTDPKGAKASLELNEQGQVLGATPSFDGSPGVNLADPRMVNRDMTIAAVVDSDGEQLSALALELQERHLLPTAVRGDDAAYAASGLDRLGGAAAGDDPSPGWAPDACLVDEVVRRLGCIRGGGGLRARGRPSAREGRTGQQPDGVPIHGRPGEHCRLRGRRMPPAERVTAARRGLMSALF